MKEHPTIFSSESTKAVLEDRKTQTRRVITPYNSIVGVGKVDWDKFDWEGKSIYISKCFEPNCNHKHEHKAPLPFADGDSKQCHQYLHVPWNWAEDSTIFRVYPKYAVGDRLWVRETWWLHKSLLLEQAALMYWKGKHPAMYFDADMTEHQRRRDEWLNGWYRKIPSISMPRWASRITLEITGLRAERLQEITEEDCEKEGLDNPCGYYCDEAVGHVDHQGTINNFAKLWDSLNAKRGYGWETNPWVWVISFRRINNVHNTT